jgi:hypothetical protein
VEAVRPAVLDSWRRCTHVPLSLGQAPVTEDAPARWRDSTAGRASGAIADELTAAAVDGDFVAAITDDEGAIVWSAGGRTMRRRAESVAFVPGGRWGEEAVGTNALGLALREDRPSTVWSAEHYAPIVHDWVCYSAPFHDPSTGRVLGVVDLSTTWRRATPLALTTVTALARVFDAVIASVPPGRSAVAGDPRRGRMRVPAALAAGAVDLAAAPTAGAAARVLELRFLGADRVSVGGVTRALPPRQLDLLAVLALAPAGLSLDALHDRLHGESPVSPATTKSEVSHLRRALGPQVVASRPYRLAVPVAADLVDVLTELRAGRLDRAIDLYGGPLLPSSAAPAVEEHRHLVDAALRNAVVAAGDVDALARLADRMPQDPYLHELVLASLPATDPRAALARAHLDTLA